MTPILVLAQMPLVESDWNAALRYYQSIEPVLRAVDGYEGVGLWRRVDQPQRHLVIYAYASVEAADRGLEAVASRKLLAEATPVSNMTPDVLRLLVSGRESQRVLAARVGEYLSLSVRVADPGYGNDLLQELSRIFQELAYLPGYIGAEYGRNETLAEEVVGLAAWKSEEAFRASLPPGALYEIQLFRRVI